MTIRFVKHNPAFLDSDQLVENFVVRQADLGLITRLVSENITGSNQHLLITGPRGSGKTVLVRRVAIAVEQHEELNNRFYPLIFSEESYLVSSAAEFWLEALCYLGRHTGIERFKQAYLELRNETDDQRVREVALSYLLEFADRKGKKLLLIVENLDMLFGDLGTEDEGKAIRQVFMSEPRLMLLGTATNLFQVIDYPSGTMFDMFKIHDLKPLGDEECNTLWGLIAGEKLSEEQIRPLKILTEGNPRMLAVLAGCGAQRPFQQLLDTLVEAIDENTDYFKSHFDVMAPIERKVYLAIAELWNISSAREIALMARLDVNNTSAYLNRLINRGVIVIQKQAKRNKLYGITEGVCNIYYLMRRYGCQAERVKAMVNFMVSFYDPFSVVSLSNGQDLEFFTAFEGAVMSVPDRKRVEQCRDHFVASEDMAKRVPGLLDTIRRIRDDWKMVAADMENTVLLESFNHAFELLEKGSYIESVPVFDAIIMVYKKRPEAHVVLKVVGAMFGKGVALGNQERREEAIQLFEDVIASCKERTEKQMTRWVVLAMFSKALMLEELERRNEAIGIYEELIAACKGRSEVEIAELVARCMLHKGLALGELDSWQEELLAYEELIAVYKGRSELEMVEQVTNAMLNKAIVLDSLQREEEAIKVYEKLILLCQERSEEQMVTKVVNAMINMGVSYGKVERYQEAEHAFMNAMELSPQQSRAQFVLLKLLIKMQERQKDAFELAAHYVDNAERVGSTLKGVITQFVELAALGYAKESLHILLGSAAERHLEPLVAALQLFTGEEVKSAVNILEVARDVVKKIEERQRIMIDVSNN